MWKSNNPSTTSTYTSTVSGIGVSQKTHKTPNTRKPRQTWKRLFSQPTRKVRVLCNLLLHRKLCTTAGSWEVKTCNHALNSLIQIQQTTWNLQAKTSPQKHVPVFIQNIKILFQTCKVIQKFTEIIPQAETSKSHKKCIVHAFPQFRKTATNVVTVVMIPVSYRSQIYHQNFVPPFEL